MVANSFQGGSAATSDRSYFVKIATMGRSYSQARSNDQSRDKMKHVT